MENHENRENRRTDFALRLKHLAPLYGANYEMLKGLHKIVVEMGHKGVGIDTSASGLQEPPKILLVRSLEELRKRLGRDTSRHWWVWWLMREAAGERPPSSLRTVEADNAQQAAEAWAAAEGLGANGAPNKASVCVLNASAPIIYLYTTEAEFRCTWWDVTVSRYGRGPRIRAAQFERAKIYDDDGEEIQLPTGWWK